jgi:hypothetical protein
MFIKVYTRDKVPASILTSCILHTKTSKGTTFTDGFTNNGKSVFIETDLEEHQIVALQQFLINCIEL